MIRGEKEGGDERKLDKGEQMRKRKEIERMEIKKTGKRRERRNG